MGKKHRDQFGLSSARVKTLWEHYLQFMVVKTFANDTGPTMKYSTSPEVDEMWHTHLLKTASYRELMGLLGEINPLVKFIDHDSDNENDPEENKNERRREAAKAFKDIFMVQRDTMPPTNRKAASPGFAAMEKLQSLSSKDAIIKRHRDQFGLSSARVKTLWEHYLQFMVVKTFANDTGPTMKYSTSPEVDEMWHT